MLHSSALRPFLEATHSFSRQRVCRYSHMGTPPLSSLPPSGSTRPTSRSHLKATVKEGIPTVLLENRSAFVKTWDFLKNPAEALALIRAVEQKYGPVESFRFQKDFDSPSTYQAQVKITFRNIESFHRISENSETLHIRAPKVQPRRPGGIGLDEIHHLVSEDVEFLTADQVSEMGPEERSIDFRVGRAQRPYFEESPYPFIGLKPRQRREIGRRMLEWGGFHQMKPMDSTQPITNEDLTEEKLDNVHMRRVLREWAQYLGVRNPYEVYPEQPAEDDRQGATPEVEVQKSSLNGVKETKSEQELPSTPDEWSASDIPQPKIVREPIEQIMDMEDINVSIKLEVQTKDSPPEVPAIPVNGTTNELESSIPGASTMNVQKASHSSGPLPDPASGSAELQTEPEPSIDSASPSKPPTQSKSPMPEHTVAQKTAPPPPKTPKSKVDQEELESQLQEAKRLGDLVRSSQKPKGKRSAKTKQKHREEPKVETLKEEVKVDPDLEPNPRFGSLFNRLQDIFKKS